MVTHSRVREQREAWVLQLGIEAGCPGSFSPTSAKSEK